MTTNKGLKLFDLKSRVCNNHFVKRVMQILFILVLSSIKSKNFAFGEEKCTNEQQCSTIDEKKTLDSSVSSTIRLITEEELSTKNGENNNPIWLSVLGEVYDVTAGSHYYGTNASYSFFAAKDASPCFASGKFNEEGLKEDLMALKPKQVKEIEHWREFYEDHENYILIGYLVGKFYDENGKATKLLKRCRKKLKYLIEKENKEKQVQAKEK